MELGVESELDKNDVFALQLFLRVLQKKTVAIHTYIHISSFSCLGQKQLGYPLKVSLPGHSSEHGVRKWAIVKVVGKLFSTATIVFLP